MRCIIGRPRVHVNRHGKEVKTNTGVSLHKLTGRYYTVGRDGKRRYHKSWDDARAALALADAANDPLVPIEIAEADYGPKPGYEPSTEPEFGWLPPARLWEAIVRLWHDHPDKFIERLGIIEYLTGTGKVSAPTSGEGPTLSKIGDAWREAMLVKHGSITPHVRETLARWNRFAKVVGGSKRRVDALTAADFRRYHTAVADQARKGKKSNKWFNDLCVAPKRVLHYVSRRYPDLGIPADVCLWANSFDSKPYQADPSNAKPVTPAEFAALRAACKAWAATDPEQFDKTTQSGRAKRLQAGRRRRAGVQMEAVLLLGLNCALDPVDIERLTWDDIHLDGKVKYLDFGRRKTAHKTGGSTPRCTPLLASTVEALEAWQAVEGRTTGQVFASARKGSFKKEFVSRAFNLLKTEASIDGGLTFKHLRNAAPTIARYTLHNSDLADIMLGHKVKGETKKYIGDPENPLTLSKLVKAVGQAYRV